MGKVTFWLETEKKHRKAIKKQIEEYCINKDYGYRVDETIKPFTSHMDVNIDVPDKNLAHEMSVFQRWAEALQP